MTYRRIQGHSYNEAPRDVQAYFPIDVDETDVALLDLEEVQKEPQNGGDQWILSNSRGSQSVSS